MSQALGYPRPHWVSHVEEDHRDLARRCLRGAEGLVLERHEQVRAASSQVRCRDARCRLVSHVPEIQLEVLSFLVAQRLQAVPETIEGGGHVVETDMEQPYPPDLARLLR